MRAAAPVEAKFPVAGGRSAVVAVIVAAGTGLCGSGREVRVRSPRGVATGRPTASRPASGACPRANGPRPRWRLTLECFLQFARDLVRRGVNVPLGDIDGPRERLVEALHQRHLSDDDQSGLA